MLLPWTTGRISLVFILATDLLLVTGLLPVPAHALVSHCRHDPIVWLDNNVKLQITVDVAATAGTPASIAYVIHVPAAVQAKRVQLTDGAASRSESVSVLSDNAANSYDTYVIAASATQVAVYVSEQIVATSQGSIEFAAQGTTNQSIHIGGVLQARESK